MPADPDPSILYHLALREEWQDAVNGSGLYRRSTLGRSLEEEGFIHCSFAHQVAATADAFYRGRDDVLLLAIDRSQVPAEVRVENLEGGEELFPHLYGPLPIGAVVQAQPVTLRPDGSLSVPEPAPEG